MDSYNVVILLLFTRVNIAFATTSFNSTQNYIQKALLWDIASIPNKNYIYVDIKVRVSCVVMPCEKYTTSDLDNVLKLRGQQRILSKGILSDQWHNDEVLANNQILNGGSSHRDVVIFSLSTNGTQDIQILELIRKYNRKCYIVIISPNNEIFNMFRKHILSKSLLNIYIVKPVGVGTVYLLYNVCAYCISGKHDVVYANTWVYQKGFKTPLLFTNSFKGKFNGATLKIGLQKNFPPTVFMVGVSDTGKPIYAGSEYWVLEFLSKYLHFEPELTENKDGTACNTNNSIFTGFCQLLMQDKVDMAGFPVAITWTNSQYFDFTAVIYQAYQVLISAKPPMKAQWNAVFKALNPDVLIAILISAICVTVVYWILLKYLTDEEPSIVNVIFVIVSILSNESTRINVSMVTGQIVIIVWCFACFFVISGIFGEITSVTAKPGLSRKPIDSTDDLIDNQMSWVTSPKFILDSELQRALAGTGLGSKSKKMVVTEGLKYILQHPLQYAYYYPIVGILPTIRVYFWNGQGQSPFHLSPGVGPPFYLTIFLPKGATYRDDISKGMLQIDAAGLIVHKFIPDATETLAKFSPLKLTHTAVKQRFFTIDKLIPSGFVLGFGSTVSLLFFIGELILYQVKNRKKM